MPLSRSHLTGPLGPLGVDTRHRSFPENRYDGLVQNPATTRIVQQYLDELAGLPGESPAEPVVRNVLTGAASRLHILCATLLFRNYPRLTQPPLNLQAEEMLSAVVERLLKAMRHVHPTTVRGFFALANQHMRWELNDLARRLDEQQSAVELRDSLIPAASQATSGSELSQNTRRMMTAIEELPEDEREVFNLIRIQGMTQIEAAEVVGVSIKTIQRRLSRGLIRLADKLVDLQPPPAFPESR